MNIWLFGNRTVGQPFLSYKEIYNGDLKAFNIYILDWEEFARDRSIWKQFLNTDLRTGTVRLI
uniref:Uncharacterized protein n=1 Tax=Arion vulgaris TaxID=1028688 RepID=A0A0B6ZLT7_9EUPU